MEPNFADQACWMTQRRVDGEIRVDWGVHPIPTLPMLTQGGGMAKGPGGDASEGVLSGVFRWRGWSKGLIIQTGM